MEVGLTIKDQYKVVEHIGRGGMADVWSARDQRLNRLVAIKTISQSLSTDVDPVAMFEQEAQTIAQMEHPHILPIYDFGDYRSNLYIVMRYVTGGSLEDKLEEKPLTLQEALQIGGNIGKALDYAHENNVIHLDLKPPNILMDSAGSPYLADFGLATVLDTQGRAQNPGSGTLLYMAPEQLVAEVIDHRADIYSFCVMMYHMLTGTLPFDGMIPLAIKQLQFRDQLPSLEDFNPEIPFQITDILRQGTSTEANQRQGSLTEIIEQMREAIRATTIDLDSASWGILGGFDEGYGMDTVVNVNMEDAGLFEAADIYSRAKHVWAGGNGRFLLGVSHFMMMSDYYTEAEFHGLEIDDMGQQMLLRGALEYDYHTDYWWEQVSNESRRWVCLHTIRSENAPARIRALYRLETLPDDDINPVIPGLVAGALAIETHKEAKLAALTVLGTRARLVKPSQVFDIKTEFRGRLLSTTTRLGLEISQPKVWQDAIYNPEIDLLIANEALDDEDDDVAELAARIIGRIHSLTSLRFIAKAQLENVPNSLRALALIRDEAPYLPDVVSRQARAYAWIANTIRRITDDPMQLVFRFLFALIGGSIGFGLQVYITFRSQQLFTGQRWGNTLAVGLLMGLFIALVVMFSNALIIRLKGFWPNWLRLIVSILFGLILSTLTWAGFNWLYLGQPPLWDLMRMGGLGLSFGLIVSSIVALKSWQSFVITATTIFLSMFASYYNWCTLLTYCNTDVVSYEQIANVTSFSIAPIALFGLIFGIIIGLFVSRPRFNTELSPVSPLALTKFGGLVTSLALGSILSFGTYYFVLAQTTITWDHVTLLFAIPILISIFSMILLDNVQRVLYIVFGLLIFAIITVYVHSALLPLETRLVPQATVNDYIDTLVTYDVYWQVFSIGLPVSVTIAFGAFALGLFGNLRGLIGLPSEYKERNAWLTGILIYVMVISALITVLSPYSLHAKPLWIIEGSFFGLFDYTIYDSILWAMGWTVLGGMTFISALATWQWKLWGARGLIICAILIIFGGFIADYRDLIVATNSGNYSPMFQIPSLVTWGSWALATGALTVGALRGKLWSAFGFIVMIFLWFIISLFFNELGDSFAALAIVHAPLVVFALRFDWNLFESGERKLKAKHAEDMPDATPTPKKQSMDGAVALTMETELDPNPMVAEAGGLQTELDLNESSDHAGDMETELDPNPMIASTGELQTEMDVQNKLNLGELATELDPNPTLTASGELQTEMDVQNKLNLGELATELDPNTMDEPIDENAKPKLKFDMNKIQENEPNKDSKPRLKIDTGLLKSKPDSEPKSQATRKGLKIDTSLLNSSPDAKPKSESRRGLKIDTDLLNSSPDAKPKSESRRGLKIDTDLLNSSPDAKPKSESRRGLKIDTSLLNSSPDAKPKSEPRKGLKIDPSLFNQKSESSESEEETDKSTKDDTLPSRVTTKMSTSKIKKEIAEEAIRIAKEAQEQKSDAKPKFKLNTSLLNASKDDELPTEEDE